LADEPEVPSGREKTRAVAKARRAKRVERREAYFDLLASGYTYHQIAGAMKVSLASVRRTIDQAIAERRLDAPEHFVQLQVARLMKALSAADMRIEQGDIRAIAPLVRLMTELNRYHGLGAKYQRLPEAWIAPEPLPARLPRPPLLLTDTLAGTSPSAAPEPESTEP
jgi:hypothetical protein